jgi:hypothetical protein
MGLHRLLGSQEVEVEVRISGQLLEGGKEIFLVLISIRG